MGKLGLDNTFARITQECGIGIWGDPQKVIAAFKDLAPKSERELKLIEMFVTSGACNTLLSSKGGLLIDQKRAYHIAIQTMQSYSYYQLEAICSICEDFMISIGIDACEWAEERRQYTPSDTHTAEDKSKRTGNDIVHSTSHDDIVSNANNRVEESIYLEVETMVLQSESATDYTDELIEGLKDGIKKLDSIRDYNARRYDIINLLKRAQSLCDRLDAEKDFKKGLYYYSAKGVDQNIKKAIKYLMLASEQGCSKASQKLGDIYCEGTHISKNSWEAIRWFKKASEQGDAVAARKLGYMYYEGLDIEKNLHEAAYWFKIAAEKGDVVAQCCLGQCYKDGLGIQKDMATAIRWLEMAAMQDYDHALWILGLCYKNGWGVVQNSEIASKYIRKAAEKNNRYAQYDYGSLIDLAGSSREQAFQWYLKSAQQGFAEAQYKLGQCYEEGWRYGIESNGTNAVKWYKESAIQGNADGQCALGNCYCFGIGVEKNPQLMLEWWEKAAKQGNSTASFNLGYSYERGENGLELNSTQAIEWYSISAEQGNSSAQEKMGELFYEGKIVKRDKKEALRWFKTAADSGSGTAKTFLDKHLKWGRLW